MGGQLQQQQGARSLNSAVMVLASFGTDEKILAVISIFAVRSPLLGIDKCGPKRVLDIDRFIQTRARSENRKSAQIGKQRERFLIEL